MVPEGGRLLKREPGSAAAGCCPSRGCWSQVAVALTWKRRQRNRVVDNSGTMVRDKVAKQVVT